MEYFSIIYKILKAIEKSMDAEEFDRNSISPEYLHISRTRWEIIMAELVSNGFISGIRDSHRRQRDAGHQGGSANFDDQRGGVPGRKYNDEKGV